MFEGDLQQRLRAFIVEEFLGDGADDLDLDTELLASGIVDSMGVMRLVSHLEQDLGVTVDDADVIPEHFRSIRAISEFAAARLTERSSTLNLG